MTVVLDSGVWVSALHFGGNPWLAIEKAFSVDRVAICDQIQHEIARVLVEKMKWSVDRVAETLATDLQRAIWVPVVGELRGVCRDRKDDMIIECALVAKARFIISGDKDLLSLAHYEGVRIITPRQYVEMQP